MELNNGSVWPGNVIDARGRFKVREVSPCVVDPKNCLHCRKIEIQAKILRRALKRMVKEMLTLLD